MPGEEKSVYDIPPIDKEWPRNLEEFCRIWLNSGETLTDEDIERWKARNLSPPRQGSLFDQAELLDPNVTLCPDCRGRGCRNCEGGVIVYRPRLIARNEEPEP